jgi:uncharacterized membrane protein YkvA (DUF1232 family)
VSATSKPHSAGIEAGGRENAMASERTMAWDFEARDREGDERTVRRDFWQKLKRVAAELPFAEDLLTAYYCAFDRETPLQVKAALLGALAYFVLPFDLVPDMLPVLGFADDAAILATAIRMVATHIRPAHRAAARRALARILQDSASSA